MNTDDWININLPWYCEIKSKDIEIPQYPNDYTNQLIINKFGDLPESLAINFKNKFHKSYRAILADKDNNSSADKDSNFPSEELKEAIYLELKIKEIDNYIKQIESTDKVLLSYFENYNNYRLLIRNIENKSFFYRSELCKPGVLIEIKRCLESETEKLLIGHINCSGGSCNCCGFSNETIILRAKVLIDY
jgi:hypothetical protein